MKMSLSQTRHFDCLVPKGIEVSFYFRLFCHFLQVGFKRFLSDNFALFSRLKNRKMCFFRHRLKRKSGRENDSRDAIQATNTAKRTDGMKFYPGANPTTCKFTTTSPEL
jgi:hypothetical protein